MRPGGTIVEGTAGNTGIGISLVGAAMGFKSVIVIPDTQSEEKKQMLRDEHVGVAEWKRHEENRNCLRIPSVNPVCLRPVRRAAVVPPFQGGTPERACCRKVPDVSFASLRIPEKP